MNRDAFFTRVETEMRNPASALRFDRPVLEFESLGLKVARCHDNAKLWVKEKAGWRRVRGWLRFPYATHHDLVAHSLVEGPHGERWDVTPYDDKQAMSLATLFVKHPGSDDEYDEAIDQMRWITYPVLDYLQATDED